MSCELSYASWLEILPTQNDRKSDRPDEQSQDEAINSDIYQSAGLIIQLITRVIPPSAAELVSHFLRIFFEAAIWNSLIVPETIERESAEEMK